VEKLQAAATGEKKKSEESQLDLTSMKSENHHLKEELSKVKEAVEKAHKTPRPSASLPPLSEEKIHALFKKIDAILE
jgi:hypothetical protein